VIAKTKATKGRRTPQEHVFMRLVGRRVAYWRTQRTLTQAQVARHLQIERTRICAIEGGRVSLTLYLASRLSRLFEVPLEALLPPPLNGRGNEMPLEAQVPLAWPVGALPLRQFPAVPPGYRARLQALQRDARPCSAGRRA
jgi:transcriptional regulator with XRE-family HTH domain